MKLSKKAATLTALVLGAVMLTTSAFADVILGSGYVGLKNSAKTTMHKLTEEVGNFTVDFTASISVDGVALEFSHDISKYDMINNRSESVSESNSSEGARYHYSDMEKSVSKSANEEEYYVSSYRRDSESTILDNPFLEEEAADVERIVDAFVGNLSDIVQVVESDGKKMYTGHLSDAQVPPVLNALTSYFAKYALIDSLNESAKKKGITLAKNEVYVLSASGKAIENEDGIIEEMVGKLSLSGKKENGVESVYDIEFSLAVTDINQTVVEVPNLEGKKVTYSQSHNILAEKYIGTYRNTIVEDDGDSFTKLGERYVEITSIEGDNVYGKYYEVMADGSMGENFEFSAAADKERYELVVSYTDSAGNVKNGILHQDGVHNIYMWLNITIEEEGKRVHHHMDNFDGQFIRIFE